MSSAGTGFSDRWLDVAGFISLVLFAWLLSVYYLPEGVGGFRDLYGYLFGRDFANIYAASCAVQEGRVDILFTQEAYQGWLDQLYGTGYPWHSWSYPPQWLTLTYAACWLAYPLAYIGYMLLGAGLFALICRRIGLSQTHTLLLLLSPIALVILWAGQNGFVTAALLLAAIHYRDKNLPLSAFAMVLLTFKPHLGIFLPLLLVFERRWKLLTVTAAGVALLIGISILLFGVEAWEQYFAVTMPLQTNLLTEQFGLFLSMMPTLFAFGRVTAVPVEINWAIQLAWSGFILLWFIRESLKKDGMPALPRVVLATCSFFPYLFNYDLLPLLAVAMQAVSASLRSGSRYWFLAAWFLLAVQFGAFTLMGVISLMPLNFLAILILMKILGEAHQR